jgi:hypothetical protein
MPSKSHEAIPLKRSKTSKDYVSNAAIIIKRTYQLIEKHK